MTAALVAGALVLGACEKSTKTTAKTGHSTVALGAINDKCPISDKPVAADAGTATWRGHTIGFCCPKCPANWNTMSAKDKDEFVAHYAKP